MTSATASRPSTAYPFRMSGATSNVDSESEALIRDALNRLMEGRTTFIVAHRISTVQRADRIIVLEAGRIVESGTHQELLRSNGHYSRLCNEQLIADHPASMQVAIG